MDCVKRQSLAIIGVGAFGEFCIPHLSPHFDVILYDAYRDISAFKASNINVVNDIKAAAQCDIIILAVPVRALAEICVAISPYLKHGQIVLDVGSVKCLPAKIMTEILPDTVSCVATHPIFGPQSGKNGIEGLNISIMNIRGNDYDTVALFLSQTLKLNVIHTTPENHDQEMAYVQGLTHMVAKIYKRMNVPEMKQSSKTYDLLLGMVNLIKNDSDELFNVIQTDNPYIAQVKKDFFSEVKALEKSLQFSEINPR